MHGVGEGLGECLTIIQSLNISIAVVQRVTVAAVGILCDRAVLRGLRTPAHQTRRGVGARLTIAMQVVVQDVAAHRVGGAFADAFTVVYGIGDVVVNLDHNRRRR